MDCRSIALIQKLPMGTGVTKKEIPTLSITLKICYTSPHVCLKAARNVNQASADQKERVNIWVTMDYLEDRLQWTEGAL